MQIWSTFDRVVFYVSLHAQVTKMCNNRSDTRPKTIHVSWVLSMYSWKTDGHFWKRYIIFPIHLLFWAKSEKAKPKGKSLVLKLCWWVTGASVRYNTVIDVPAGTYSCLVWKETYNDTSYVVCTTSLVSFRHQSSCTFLGIFYHLDHAYGFLRIKTEMCCHVQRIMNAIKGEILKGEFRKSNGTSYIVRYHVPETITCKNEKLKWAINLFLLKFSYICLWANEGRIGVVILENSLQCHTMR